MYSLPAGYLAVTGDTITAAQHNDPLEDLETDMNTARPVVAGGTGATSAADARTNLAVPGLAGTETVTGTWTVTGTLNVDDDAFFLRDNADTTKKAAFQLSGITTGTTRTFTLPDYDATLATVAGTETFTNKTLTSPTISGGTIDNTIIGGTTASTGAFTTLSASQLMTVDISPGASGAMDALKLVNSHGANTSNTVELAFWAHRGVTANFEFGSFGVVTTEIGASTGTGDFIWELANLGTKAEKMRLSGNGNVTFTGSLNRSGADWTIGTTDANDLILQANSTEAMRIDSSQNATFAGSINIDPTESISGGAELVNDDAATSWNPARNAGTAILHVANVGSVIFGFRVTGSPAATEFGDLGGFTVTTGALTGTTGADGVFTVSAHSDGKIYFENRSGTNRTVRLLLLC